MKQQSREQHHRAMKSAGDDWRRIRLARETEIGFPEDRSAFKTCEPVFDQDGKTLKMLGHSVMERWEEPYMAMLAEIATSRGGRVLEVGFGMGISAGFIQQHSPAEHVIIEANAEVARLAREFAAQHSNRITVLEGFWEDVVPGLPGDSFDGILFDTIWFSEDEVNSGLQPFVSHAYRLLKPRGVFAYFSDEATDLNIDDLTLLRSAGFTKIRGQLCEVSPPPNCEYWWQETMFAPIVEK